jgi:hypothetical protein
MSQDGHDTTSKDSSDGDLTLPSPPPLKKQKLLAKKSDESKPEEAEEEDVAIIGFGNLDPLTYNVLFSFLDVKSLFRVTFCSKVLMRVVSHEHVVRSAVFSGGNVKYTMHAIVALIQKNSIVVPSPLRMLRLTNGRYCERGSECDAWRTAKERKKVRAVRADYGVFFCSECVTSCTKHLSLTSPMLTHERALPSVYHCRKAYGMIDTFTDKAGERCGTLLSYEEYQQQYQQQQLGCMQHKARKVIETHIHALENPWVYKRPDIDRCFQQAKHDQETIEWQAQKERTSRESMAFAKKVERLKTLVELLRSFLTASVPRGWDWDKTWIEDLLTCKYIDPERDYYHSKRPCAFFSCPLVNKRMEPYGCSPSKGNKKKMKEIADQLGDEMQLLWSTRFHDFTFLSEDAEPEPLEYSLRVFFKDNYSFRKVLKCSAMDYQLMDLLRRNQLLRALKYVGKCYDSSNHTYSSNHKLFTSAKYGRFDEAFARAMVGSITNSTNSTDQSTPMDQVDVDVKELAVTIWTVCNTMSKKSPEDKNAYAKLYADASVRFAKMLPLAQEYVQFIRESSYEGAEQEDDSPEDILRIERICCSYVWNDQRALECLETRGFDAARDRAWEAYRYTRLHSYYHI